MRLVHLLIINFLISTCCLASWTSSNHVSNHVDESISYNPKPISYNKVTLNTFFINNNAVDPKLIKVHPNITMTDYLHKNNRFELFFENRMLWSPSCQKLLYDNAYCYTYDLLLALSSKDFHIGFQVITRATLKNGHLPYAPLNARRDPKYDYSQHHFGSPTVVTPYTIESFPGPPMPIVDVLKAQRYVEFQTDIINSNGQSLKKLNLFFYINIDAKLACMVESDYR